MAGAVGARLMVYVNPFLIWTPTKAEGGNATRNLYDEANYLGMRVATCLEKLKSKLNGRGYLGYLVKYSGNTTNGW